MSRKSIIILVVGSALILIPIIIFVVWVLTQDSTQVAPTDSSAVECVAPTCEAGGSCHAEGDTAVNGDNGCTYTCSNGSWVDPQNCDNGDNNEDPTCNQYEFGVQGSCNEEGLGCRPKRCNDPYVGDWSESCEFCTDPNQTCVEQGDNFQCVNSGTGGTCEAPCQFVQGPGNQGGNTMEVYYCEGGFSCANAADTGICAQRCDVGAIHSAETSNVSAGSCYDSDGLEMPCDCYYRQQDWFNNGVFAGYTLTNASKSGAECEPQDDPPACTVTNSANCIIDGNDVSADVSWNVTSSNFTIGQADNEGYVVIRMNNLDDGTWFVQGNDTYWATNYQEFITSGLNPSNATWNFDVRNGQEGEYDAVVADTNYDVYAAVYETKDDTTPVCTGTPDEFNCNIPDTPPECGDGVCNQSSETCENGSSCPTTPSGPIEQVSCRSNCTYCGDGNIDAGEECDDGNRVDDDSCSNLCLNEVIITEPYCGDGTCNQATELCENNLSCDTGDAVSCRGNCTYCGDGVLNGNEQCDDGNDVDTDDCRNDCSYPSCGDGITDPGEECDDGNTVDDDMCTNDCKVPQPPDWEIEKIADPSCSSGKEVSAAVLYKVTVTNNGLGEGVLDRVVDTLDPSVDPSWVETDTMIPDGVLAGNVITWTLSVADSTFAPGEQKEFVYTVNVPYSAFGDLTNTAEGFPVSEASFSITNVTNVYCSVDGGPLPDTGILDSTVGRVGVGLLLISLSSAYVYFDGIDRALMKLFYKDERYRFAKKDFEDKVGK